MGGEDIFLMELETGYGEAFLLVFGGGFSEFLVFVTHPRRRVLFSLCFSFFGWIREECSMESAHGLCVCNRRVQLYYVTY